jgi:hypothetical protein
MLECGLKVATSCNNHFNSYHTRLKSSLQTFMAQLNLGSSLIKKKKFSIPPHGMKGLLDVRFTFTTRVLCVIYWFNSCVPELVDINFLYR